MIHLRKHNGVKNFPTIKFIFIFSIVLCNFFSCKNKKDNNTDTHFEGTIHICVDESFQPIISQEILVFQATHPKAHILVKYEAESECFKDFQNDSVTMIIVARGLKEEESVYYNNIIGHRPFFSVMAFDAVAVVVNAQTQDSVFSIQQLNNILTSSVRGNTQAIVDGNNLTSTISYLMDSITKGKPFGVNVQGVNGSKTVLDAIAANKNAIGFVGSSWIGNENDPEQAAYATQVHTAYIENKQQEKDSVEYAKPSQATIWNEQYPLYRPLYCITKDAEASLGTSFYNFMSYQRGQLIFRVGNLVPAKMNFTIRNVTESIKDRKK